MKKSILLLIAGLVFSTVSMASDWHVVTQGVVGVVSDSTKAKLELTTVTSDDAKHDTGVAFYYYPPTQPTVCSVTQDIYKTFTVNGLQIPFRKFCIEGDKQPTAYTPATQSDAAKFVGELAHPETDYVTIDGEVFSLIKFPEMVTRLLNE